MSETKAEKWWYRAYVRKRDGISLTKVCVECGTLFHPVGNGKRCPTCKKEKDESYWLKYQNTRELISLGFANPDALDKLYQEMIEEEGELVAEELCGPARAYVAKVVEERGYR